MRADVSFIKVAIILAIGGLVAGCDVTTKSSSGDAATAQEPKSCGVVLYTDPVCQSWLDDNCCDFEKRCDASCRAIIACVNACPTPKTADCLGTCAGNFDQTTLDDLANCSKSAAPPAGRTCEWP
jgi:hypothetical protein